MIESESLKSGVHLSEAEFRAYHLERPGFRVSEIHLSSSQQIPWHLHTHISDTFYVMSGEMRLFLQSPKEAMNLLPGDSYCVEAGRPHLVTNAGDELMTFVVLQGVGEYDYVPLVNKGS